MKTNSILVATLFFVASNAMASNWLLIGKNNDVTLFADTQSLKIDSNVRTIWIKYVYKQLQKLQDNKKSYYEYTSYQGLNCKDQTYAVYESVFYGKNGTVVYSTPYDNYPSWEPVVPDSYGDTTITAVCAFPEYKNTTPIPPSSTASQPSEGNNRGQTPIIHYLNLNSAISAGLAANNISK